MKHHFIANILTKLFTLHNYDLSVKLHKVTNTFVTMG